MQIDILKRILLESQEIITNKDIIFRNYDVPNTDNIKIFTGIRRCGKTFTLYQNAKKYNPEEILFLDFEDERLIHLNALKNYDIIIDAYSKLKQYPHIQAIISTQRYLQ